MRPRLAAALAAALALTVLPAAAIGDGDPASDVLLGQNVFYPYNPAVSGKLEKTLNAATAAASKAHFPIKVALIASPVDLGVIPDLFGKPQKYADFLDQEISFQGKQLLLVVMKAGYGTQALPAAATAAAGKLSLPAGGTSDDLAQAAITAVAKLASAAGTPISGVPGLPGSGGGGGGGAGGKTLIVVLLALAALATAGALILVRRRQPTR
jgi:hypothetical protein